MRKQCVPGSLSSSPTQEPGNEASAGQTYTNRIMAERVSCVVALYPGYMQITPQVEKIQEKPQMCMCMSNALAFLFPSLRGPPEVDTTAGYSCH